MITKRKLLELLLIELTLQLAKINLKEILVFLASHGEFDADEAQALIKKYKLLNI